MLRSGLFLVIASLASGFIVTVPLQAAEPKVNDQAKFFSQSAIEQAVRKMEDIYRRYKVEIVVDTLSALPENVQSQYDKEKDTDKKNFFRRWARRRAADAGVKGIYILICKNPPHAVVEPDDTVRPKGFTQSESDQLAKNIAGYFHTQSYDTALTEAVDFIQNNLQDNLRRTGAAPPAEQRNQGQNTWPGPQAGGNGAGLGGWICFGVVALLVIWLISAVIRAFRGGSGYGGMQGGGGPGGMGGGYGPGYGGGGGGGFFSSLLGGMFGAAAGNWLYDSFRGGSGQGSTMSGQSGFGSTDQGQDVLPADQSGAGNYSPDDNAGGDATFGDDTSSSNDSYSDGGGDFGGSGDFGGGGGDFGGGGDSGGGGGDSSW